MCLALSKPDERVCRREPSSAEQADSLARPSFFPPHLLLERTEAPCWGYGLVRTKLLRQSPAWV